MSSYVDIQRRVNLHHTDGRTESQDEQAIRWARVFSRWIKRTRYPVESILDAGCRTGYAIEEFAAEFPSARVAGIDIVPEFVEKASLRGEAHVGDLQALPFDDGEFDWTFCSTAIEHCPDVGKAGAELMRVTKVGLLIITDLEDEDKFSQNPSHFTHHADPIEWVLALRQPGWQLMRLDVPHCTRVELLWLRSKYARTYAIEGVD